MANSMKGRGTTGEETAAELQQEREAWVIRLGHLATDIHFLKNLIKAPIFRPVHDLYEKLENFSKKLLAYKEKLHELNQQVEHHKHDLEGLLECDDISCESFYYEQHSRLKSRVLQFEEQMRNLQSQIFSSLSNLLLGKNNN